MIFIYLCTKIQPMRKLFYILFCLLLTLAAQAEEHMEFMGITMGMSVDDFTAALKEKGYTLSAESAKAPKGKRLMQGDFNGGAVTLVLNYGVHTGQMTSLDLRFPQEKEFSKFLDFYEAMKRIVTEQYCTEGEVINEQGNMDTLPKYGMKMDYGTVTISIDPNKAFTLILTYTDQHNTLEERKLRYD